MGVKGLWTLLEPVGRRIDVQAISNKRLAVDASIWLFQFMRAMRNDQGEMIKNAHLLGFFRRICRLLFHKVQPIFVFEGTTPALKRATTAARRARREHHSAALKRAAEKLLVNQIKRQALLEAQRQREQQQQQRRQGASGDATADSDAGVESGSRKRRKASSAAAAAAELKAARADSSAAAAAAEEAEAGPSSKHQQFQATSGTDVDPEDLLLAATLAASAAAAADPKGKQPAVAVEANLPQHVLQVLKDTEQQYNTIAGSNSGTEGLTADAGTLTDSARHRLAQEEADAELALQLDKEINSRAAENSAAAAAAASDSHVDHEAVLQFASGNRRRSKVQQSYDEDNVEQQQQQRQKRLQPAAVQEQQQLLRAIAVKRQQQQRRAAADWEPDDDYETAAAAVAGEDKFTRLLNLKGPEFIGGGASTAAAGADGSDMGSDDDDDDDGAAANFLLPSDVSNLDPAVLSTLPQSVQLDILEKMRDAQQAANRDKFLQAAAAPQAFSQVQMDTYLRASRFKQQIERHKKALGAARGGPQEAGEQIRGRHMASEHTREFIFARETQSQPNNTDTKPHIANMSAASGGFMPQAAAAGGNPSWAGALSDKPAGGSPSRRYGGKRKRKFEKYLDDLKTAESTRPQRGFRPEMMPAGSLEGVKGLAAFSSVLKQWEGMNQQQQQQHEEEEGFSQGNVMSGPASAVGGAAAAAVTVKQEPDVAPVSASRSTSQVAAAAASHQAAAAATAAATAAAAAAAAVQQSGVATTGSLPAAQIAVSIDLCVKSDDEDLFAGLGDSSSENSDTGGEPLDTGPPLASQSAAAAAAAATGAEGLLINQLQGTAADTNDSEDWEDIEAAAPQAQQQQQPPFAIADPSQQQQQQQPSQEGDDKALPAWRQRMAVRHKFWSSSHGFKLGRKLGDWAAAEQTTPAPVAAAAAGGGVKIGSLGGLESAAAAAGGVVAAVVTGTMHRSPVKPLLGSRSARRSLSISGNAADEGVDLTVGSDEEYDADVQQAIQASLAEAAGTAAPGIAVDHKTAGGVEVDDAGMDEDWEDVDELTAVTAAAAAAEVNSEAPSSPVKRVAAVAPATAAAPPEFLDQKSSSGVAVAAQNQAYHQQPQQQQRQQESLLSFPIPDAQQETSPTKDANNKDALDNAIPDSSRVNDVPAVVSLAAHINASSSRRLEQHPAVAPRNAQAVAEMHRDLMAAAAQTAGDGERAETAAARADEATEGQHEQADVFDTQDELLGLPDAVAAAAAAPDSLVSARDADDAPTPVQNHAAGGVAPGTADVADDVAEQHQHKQDDVQSFDFSFMQESVLKPAKASTPPPAANSAATAGRMRLKPAGGAAVGSTGNKLSMRIGSFVVQQKVNDRSDGKVPGGTAEAPGPAVVAALPVKQPERQQTEHGQQQQVSGRKLSPFGEVQLPESEPYQQPDAAAQPLPQQQQQQQQPPQQQNQEQLLKQQRRQQQHPEQSVDSQVSQQQTAGQQYQTAQPVDIDSELAALEEEHRQLKSSVAAASRNTATPTQEMVQECQELLTLFGIPFIVAPAEAEAQCAWLEAAGLVDGVVTDDNDAFLFGSQHVYRHLFEDKKYVEEYHMSDISSELGVNRDQLVCLALLLGSDYTEGVQGIGVVNALEVVSAWSGGLSGLQKFKQWLEGPDERLVAAAKRAAGTESCVSKQRKLRKKASRQDSMQPSNSKAGTDSASRGDGADAEVVKDAALQCEQVDGGRGGRRGRRSAGVRVGQRGRGRGARKGSKETSAAAADAAVDSDDDVVVLEGSDEKGGSKQRQRSASAAAYEEESKAQQDFKRAHKGVRRSWQLPASFPDARVAEAYSAPLVDRNAGKFTFGKPDTSLLQAFCRERFGWDQTKIDELLLPVLRSYSERSTQLRMDQFLTHKQRFAKVRSKRLQKAITAITGVEVNPDLFYAEFRHLPELPSYEHNDREEQQESKEGTAPEQPMVQTQQNIQGVSVESGTLQRQRQPGSRAKSGRASASLGAAAEQSAREPIIDAVDDMGSAQSDLAFVRLMQTAAD